MARRRNESRISRQRRERKYRLRAKSTRFIPDADSDFACMARVFAEHVMENCERFGIAAAQAEQMMEAVTMFRHALNRTLRHDSAGPAATMMKNKARNEAEKHVRAAARLLRATGTLTVEDRVVLRMKERPEKLQPLTCPNEAPELEFIGSTLGTGSSRPLHILEFWNGFDRLSSAKPRGAVRLELYVAIVPLDAPLPSSPEEPLGGPVWYLRSFTTKRFEVEYPVFADGTPMRVVYWARWADARGGQGPFSKPCVSRVEGGPLVQPMFMGKRAGALPTASRLVEPRRVLQPRMEVTQVLAALPGKVEAGAVGVAEGAGARRLLESA